LACGGQTRWPRRTMASGPHKSGPAGDKRGAIGPGQQQRSAATRGDAMMRVTVTTAAPASAAGIPGTSSGAALWLLHPWLLHPWLLHPRLLHPRLLHPRLLHPRLLHPRLLQLQEMELIQLPDAQQRPPGLPYGSGQMTAGCHRMAVASEREGA
jgi:hypothetical protein